MGTYQSLAFALVLVTAITAASTPVQGAPPSIAVSVDGTDLSDGGTVTVTDDPSVTIDVSAEQPIESVDVRVNGTSRESFTPNSSSFSETITLDLEEGDNQLRVVATAGDTASITGTVQLDAEAPRVAYTSPFQTNRYEGPPDEVVVEGSAVSLAGELYDTTDIERLTIEWIYEYEFAGTSERARETYRLQDPGESFDQELLLGLGTNDVKVQLRDENGHTTVHEFDLRLIDDRKPVIELDTVERTGDGAVHIRGVIHDNVKVNSLSVGVNSLGSSTYLINPTDSEPEARRRSMPFETTMPVPEDAEELKLVGDDVAGNSRTRTVPIGYTPQTAPDISIDEDATAITDGTVAVAGVVSGGEITSVKVETVAENGDIVDFTTVYSGDTTDRVTIDVPLEAAATGGTTVRVRATDSTGEEHVRSLALAPATTATPEPTATATPEPTATATPEPTATATPEPTATATATPTASGGSGGSPPLPFGTMDVSLVLWFFAVGLTYATRGDPTGHFWSRVAGAVSVVATVIGGGIALAGGSVPILKFLVAVALFAVWWWLRPGTAMGGTPSPASTGHDTRIYGNGGDDGTDTNVYDPDSDDDTEIYNPDDEDDN